MTERRPLKGDALYGFVGVEVSGAAPIRGFGRKLTDEDESIGTVSRDEEEINSTVEHFNYFS